MPLKSAKVVLDRIALTFIDAFVLRTAGEFRLNTASGVLTVLTILWPGEELREIREDNPSSKPHKFNLSQTLVRSILIQSTDQPAAASQRMA